jgi:hypothetical protein
MSVSLIPSGAFNIVAKDVEKHLAKSIEMAHGAREYGWYMGGFA